MTKEEPVYSRDEIVAALIGYYEFLSGVHITSSAIKYPPSGGWPQITRDYLVFLNKNDTVVDLIRHIPFIQRDDLYDPYEIYEKTTAVDYTGKFFHESATDVRPDPSVCEPEEEMSTVPPHVMTLATTPGARDGHYLFLDTSRGTITVCDFQVGGDATDLSLPDDGSSEEWRSYPTYIVKDFFEMLKEKFKSFEVLAINEREVKLGRQINDQKLARLKEVYRECGWLKRDYRKEECLKRAKEITDV